MPTSGDFFLSFFISKVNVLRRAFGQSVRNLRRCFDDVTNMIALNRLDDGINRGRAVLSARDNDGQPAGTLASDFKVKLPLPS